MLTFIFHDIFYARATRFTSLSYKMGSCRFNILKPADRSETVKSSSCLSTDSFVFLARCLSCRVVRVGKKTLVPIPTRAVSCNPSHAVLPKFTETCLAIYAILNCNNRLLLRYPQTKCLLAFKSVEQLTM